MSAAVKEAVINMVRSLPDEATIDDIMSELYFKIQVDEGLKELDEGKGIPHEKVEERLSRWLSKHNREKKLIPDRQLDKKLTAYSRLRLHPDFTVVTPQDFVDNGQA
ncbi:MAG: hypothetical protein KAW12_27355 [Candidatus Aminicenantes bacterium]|nr:hypothetical protein [Candidatus Aminicenantes bacterium]